MGSRACEGPAPFFLYFPLFHMYHFYGLDTFCVHGMHLVGSAGEVNGVEVNATYGIVVGRFVVNAAVGQVGRGSPLRGTGQVRGFSYGMFQSDGYIEIVEQVETERDGREPISLLWSCVT